MCGKNQQFHYITRYPVGSPPRVREEQYDAWQDEGKAGITPACAGRTSAVPRQGSAPGDHPRVCGKNRCASIRTEALMGSPPRVREEPSIFSASVIYPRITPACAGRTRQETDAYAIQEDHPRVCGKNFVALPNRGCHKGSPPRVREEPIHCCTGFFFFRITPACAGRTFSPPSITIIR